jgi:phytoene dehydrogenase-like protein
MTQHTTIEVVGGGLAGLVAAVECAEQGFAVRLRESSHVLGGRARTTTGDARANLGPHVVYDDGPFWAWLDARGLARPAARLVAPTIRFRHDGALHRLPPAGVTTAIMKLRGTDAPVDVDFRTWIASHTNERDAEALVRLAGVFSYDHDPGRWSAAFVWERLVRIFGRLRPPAARYVPGGWGTMVERIATHAQRLGVRIETDAPVRTLPDAPVILAVPLRVARALLDDDTVTWSGTRTQLLDLQLRGGRRGARGPFIVSDLDEGGWVERFSDRDSTLAPPGHELLQAQIGVRPGEPREESLARLEALVDLGYPGWRDREVWRRASVVADQTGALDPPGTTWRDRPAVVQREGVFLAGDMVAAPGLLSEVSHASAVDAAHHAVAGSGRRSEVNRLTSATKTS